MTAGAGGLRPPLSDRSGSVLPRGARPTRSLRDALYQALLRRLTTRGLFIGAIFLTAVRLITVPVEDPDYWWHVAIGRWMVANRALPTHDIFTYTVGQHAWVDHEYLTEIGLFLLQAAFGLLGVSFVFGAVTLAAIWLIDRRSQLEAQPYVIRGLGLALAIAAGAPLWGPRAQMLTFLFVCLELYWLERFLRRGDRRVYFLAPLMTLWANLHGGFVIGFLFLGLAVVERLLGWVARRDSSLLRDASRLGLLTAGCAAAALLTPNTYRLYLYAAATQVSPAQQDLIVEWSSPNFHAAMFRPFELLLLALVVGFALSRPRLYDVLLALAALGLALQSARHIALFIAACTPVLIRLYGEAWTRAAQSRQWRLPRAAPSLRLAAASAAALLILTAAIGFLTAGELSRQQSLIRDRYPVAAANWLASHPDVGKRMFNAYGWGGYLVYRLYPQSRVAIFGEAALMGDDRLRRYAAVVYLKPDWEAQLDRQGVDSVVIERGTPLAETLAVDPQWKLTYEDRVAVIFVRVL